MLFQVSYNSETDKIENKVAINYNNTEHLKNTGCSLKTHLVQSFRTAL